MRTAMIGILSAALLCPLVVGCGDKEVSHSEDQTHNPITGNTTTTDKTTYQRSDGTTYTNKDQQTSPGH